MSTTSGKQREKEVEQMQRDRLSMVAEVEELKRRLASLASVERELRSQITRMEREKAAYKQHVEAVICHIPNKLS